VPNFSHVQILNEAFELNQIYFTPKNEVNIMADKESARTDGYKRGLEGKGSSSSWGDAFGDSLVNESGSSQARREGYEQGRRDREFKKNS
jgi:hypothetical protein